jgi:hypothetical protein
LGTTQENQFHAISGAAAISRCILQGWTGSLGGSGNNGSNPSFIDDDGADNTAGTLDDNLRLAAASPAVETGETAALPPDTADLNGNANTIEPTPLDLDDHPRVLGSSVDRGAYELVPVIPADFDHDGDVDTTDFDHLKGCATRSLVPQNNPACLNARLDADTDVDMSDFSILQRCFSGAMLPARVNCAN